MKFISLGLILLGSLGFNTAMGANQAELTSSPKVLSCARSIVEQGRGGTSGLLFIAKLLESEIGDEKKLSHCKSFLLTAEKLSKVDRKNYSKFIAGLSSKQSSKDLLNSFNRPYYECRYKNIESPIANGFGLASDLGAAKCVGSNGRSYIILVDKKSYNLDFISKAFSENIYIDKNNKLLDLDSGAAAYAIGEYLGEVLETDLELDEIGTRTLSSKANLKSFKPFGRFKAISIDQV